ncbi:MAG TPA: hypothetical protein VMU15_20215 [Anaeromyxobacter sp.]|nr:hypothetical protein [Anaeromyxobacter sp.]
MTHRRTVAAAALALGALLAACSGSGPRLPNLTPAVHSYFPIASGDHANLDCATCHTDPATFSKFDCVGCHTHDQTPTDLVHNSVTGYAFATASCYQCHPAPTRQPFSHTGITGNCAGCHAVGASFAALPVAGFTHQAITSDCSGCHKTSSWATAAKPSGPVHDPLKDVAVTGQVPSFTATTIVRLTAVAQDLPMTMNHDSTAIDATVLGTCGDCHADASSGTFYPGSLHSSLANLGLAQPATCVDCHSDAAPVGFVGPVASHPARSPPSGEMRHDAVAWSGGAPTTTALVTAECGVCHAPPSATLAATWSSGAAGTGAPAYHASLGSAQPTSCLDCHANTRPTGLLTSANASMPPGQSFDHTAPAALGDCASCHATAAATSGYSSWAGGRFHHSGDTTPTSCLPCHGGERPISTSGWATSYTASPFDYVTNAAGITHGDGLDCAACHTGPGTGTWGSSQNWVNGHFAHGAGTAAASTCIACHMTQRPDLQPGATEASAAALLGFDHTLNGTGDCFGCHQATVAAGSYVNYLNPSTHALPGGDWKGAQGYPGSTLAASDQYISVTEIALQRTGSLVTGMSSTTATIYNAMLHTSTAIPSVIFPGPTNAPNNATCWHCHTHDSSGTVTSFALGRFHTALTSYSATVGGAVTPLPQPTAQCADCHAQMVPTGIVEHLASDLQPMDHSALFTSTASIGGVSASGVPGLDCSTCHKSPGSTWADGLFHASIGSAVPADCTACHYPLMADAARADLSSGTLYRMSHRSTTVTVQRCDACHTSALGKSTTTPAASTLWQTGAFHPSLSAQPTSCLDCHSSTAPTAPTQSTVSYLLAAGGTATNGGQWMSHADSAVAALDCAACHQADAQPSGAAWSRSTAFHARVASPGTCANCHGLTNGNGSTIGTGNNLPTGLTSSSTLTTASSDASTGVPAGTYDQITHADVNATGHDCAFCHTQVGPSTAAGISGKEWAQASFHTNFSASTPLVLNLTTGRCSDCHMNVKPGSSFTAQDHSTFTSASGTDDCSKCHSWPGTGTPAAPNWLGATGVPPYIVVGGFTIPAPPAATPTTQAGITNLPHPSTATLACATCHTGGVGGLQAIGYDHASTLINSACNACHEAGTDLIGTAWNGATTQSAGAGDSRPFTLTSILARRGTGGDSCTITRANHFYPVDCAECHASPAGTGATTSGTSYTNAWTFPHTTSKMSNPSTCNLCHSGQGCGT